MMIRTVISLYPMYHLEPQRTVCQAQRLTRKSGDARLLSLFTDGYSCHQRLKAHVRKPQNIAVLEGKSNKASNKMHMGNKGRKLLNCFDPPILHYWGSYFIRPAPTCSKAKVWILTADAMYG